MKLKHPNNFDSLFVERREWLERNGVIVLQYFRELYAFWEVVRNMAPINLVLEIGLYQGGVFALLDTIIAKSATFIGIDNGINDPDISPLILKAVITELQKSRPDTFLIQGDSHSRETIETFLKYSRGRPIDVLFIDGDHTYDGVKADFENYGIYIRPGGIIAFHDISTNKGPGTAGHRIVEVPRFWNEIKEFWPHDEFLGEGSTMGIGVLYR